MSKNISTLREKEIYLIILLKFLFFRSSDNVLKSINISMRLIKDLSNIYWESTLQRSANFVNNTTFKLMSQITNSSLTTLLLRASKKWGPALLISDAMRSLFFCSPPAFGQHLPRDVLTAFNINWANTCDTSKFFRTCSERWYIAGHQPSCVVNFQ